jgi:hypothetical protein
LFAKSLLGLKAKAGLSTKCQDKIAQIKVNAKQIGR